MAEQVETGGVMTFRYGREHQPVLDGKLKKDIEKAYARASERKKRERLRKSLWWILGIIIFLILIAAIFLWRT